MMELWGAPGHRSCSDNYRDALAEFGLTLDDVYSPASINLFANPCIESIGDGRLTMSPPTAEKGDHVDFLAEMDVLVALSACPDDVSSQNGRRCKPVRVRILD